MKHLAGQHVLVLAASILGASSSWMACCMHNICVGCCLTTVVTAIAVLMTSDQKPLTRSSLVRSVSPNNELERTSRCAATAIPSIVRDDFLYRIRATEAVFPMPSPFWITDRKNPRKLRLQDPKLKKEFDYLIYDLDNGVELRLVKISAKGKKFMIGSPKNEPDRREDEEQREIAFTRDYYIGVYEVTRRQFRRFSDESGYKTDGEQLAASVAGVHTWRRPSYEQSDSHPVEFISWNDAKQFCMWLAKKGEKRYTVRLPGEAEWEYACRAGSKSRFHFGDKEEDFPRFENIGDLDYEKATSNLVAVKFSDGHGCGAPVGSYKPNAFGLYDMLGNVREWCEDHDGKYSDLPKANNQIQTAWSLARVKRGGDWCLAPEFCRTACRASDGPREFSIATGFRIAVVESDEP